LKESEDLFSRGHGHGGKRKKKAWRLGVFLGVRANVALAIFSAATSGRSVLEEVELRFAASQVLNT
jgi:hypothetical protein